MKKIIYNLNTGERYECATAFELVQCMKRDSWMPQGTDEEFMQETAKRVATMCHRTIKHSNAEEFVAGLIDVGLINIGDEDAIEEK